MNRIVLILMLALAALAGGGWYIWRQFNPEPAQAAELDPRHAEIATRFLDHLDAGAYAAALELANARMREALPDSELRTVWETLPRQLGPRQSRSALRGEQIGDTRVATTTLTFAPLALDARIAVDADGLVSGFRLLPAAKTTSSEAAPLASSAHWSERAIQIGAGDSALPGTLTLPTGTGPFPAVVLVHGSGPQDRDARVGDIRVFRDLAHGLAERGIASLRYDKRSFARPQDFSAGDFTIDLETTHDAAAAVALLHTVEGIDPARIVLVGHSQGAMMAPRIAQRAPRLAGLVLLAAPARPLQTLYLEQITYLAALDGDLSDAERRQIDEETAKAEAIATLAADSPADRNSLGLPARYWIDLRGYDPIQTARGLTLPMLVLQGGRDYQVQPEADFGAWSQAFANDARVRLVLLDGLNHLFVAGEGTPGPADYARPGRVDARAIKAIGDWIDTLPTTASQP